MSQSERQERETDKVKALLAGYRKLQRRIDNAEARLVCLEASMGAPSTPNLSGMPSGGRDGSSKTERDVIRKAELEEKIADMYAEENRLLGEIEELIESMDKPDEQTVIEMHYIDGAKWWPICEALYENEPDYEEDPKRYLKRTFRLHGSALQTLARIYHREEK